MPQRHDNPDRDFSAGYEELKFVPEYDYRDLFDDPAIRERIGETIAAALTMRLDTMRERAARRVHDWITASPAPARTALIHSASMSRIPLAVCRLLVCAG
jgi:hypothetical protein